LRCDARLSVIEKRDIDAEYHQGPRVYSQLRPGACLEAQAGIPAIPLPMRADNPYPWSRVRVTASAGTSKVRASTSDTCELVPVTVLCGTLNKAERPLSHLYGIFRICICFKHILISFINNFYQR
jgi:hypothetical protein